ncbi:DUF2189 domain-containing protein [Cohaesibacter intestini]|uniref:DUF2189 domain-containing protein n=1 Tax=Cohaesibacter intestini TaxID=2211145 RepID=UPI0013002F0E|nr:DUF2189 domain-containing protein [Cohaesibacter intestini]
MTDAIDAGSVTLEGKNKDAAPARKMPKPIIQTLTTDDLTEALSAGLRDFQATAMYGLFFGAFYAIGGWLLLWLMSSYNLPYLAYPLASGFALIAPFIAAGLYEISRRRELGLPLGWSHVLGAIFSPQSKELRWMALVTGFAFIIWIDIAIFLYVIFFGLQSINVSELITTIVTTPEGALFLLVGNLVGAALGVAVFSITAISFPLLLDKDVDFITGMITSIKCVLTNQKAMLSWAIFIAFMLMISLASFLLGLIFVLPLLGHATWHLYKRAILFEEATFSDATDDIQ